MAKQTERPESSTPTTNLFLARLEREDYDALIRESKIVSLKFRRRVLHQDARVEAVYFPLTCMFSLLVTSNGQPQMEMATIGREGIVGAAEVLQAKGAFGLNLIQIPGTALRIAAEAFRKLVVSHPRVQQLVREHMYALMRQILYGASCNRLHTMEERCVRSLLMTHDRAGQDTFPLTQEFLSHMLGVRRASVNLAAGMLKKAGFVRYVRGKITVIDRPGLESASCDYYRAIVKVYASLWRRFNPLVIENKLKHSVTVYSTTLPASRGKKPFASRVHG
jgi:CRP-like cAMP-binding protein